MTSKNELARIEGVGIVAYADGFKAVEILGYFEFHHRKFVLHRNATNKNIFCVSEASTGLMVSEGKTTDDALKRANNLLSCKKMELCTRIQDYLVKTQHNLSQSNLGVTLWSIL